MKYDDVTHSNQEVYTDKCVIAFPLYKGFDYLAAISLSEQLSAGMRKLLTSKEDIPHAADIMYEGWKKKVAIELTANNGNLATLVDELRSINGVEISSELNDDLMSRLRAKVDESRRFIDRDTFYRNSELYGYEDQSADNRQYAECLHN